ncbi:hypothetical protein [Gemmatimonas sp.]|uniref:hypothetical protein n=1 Tax=Gemmatimonas sp. TaxID=1962908 RepID=UPI00286DF0E0|nr:hypothetical protein [Gemmatimonas sp.]
MQVFPVSIEQRNLATSHPARFVLREWFRFAAILSFVNVVMDVLFPENIFVGHPTRRLYFVVSWAVCMSVFTLWSARRGTRAKQLSATRR